MPATYHVGSRGFVGYEAPILSANGTTVRSVIPAVALVDGTGADTGTAAAPLNTRAAPLTAGTDRSGTTSATANTSTQLAAANTSRLGLDVQNISANPLGISENGAAAAIGSPGTYTIPAGASFTVRTNRAINIVSGTASQPYTATER